MLPGNFVIEREIRLQIPGGLSPDHRLKPGVMVAKFCRPLTGVGQNSEWLPRWAELVEVLQAQPIGYMGVVLLWQYHLSAVPRGHYLVHDDPDFSALCHVRCATAGIKPVMMFEQRIDLQLIPPTHQFICFCFQN